MPGPAPSPNARRTNDKAAWRTLPAWCEAPAPAWPLRAASPARRSRLDGAPAWP